MQTYNLTPPDSVQFTGLRLIVFVGVIHEIGKQLYFHVACVPRMIILTIKVQEILQY